MGASQNRPNTILLHSTKVLISDVSRYLSGSMAQSLSRPGQTAHCLQVRDRKWGARGPSGRLASAKLVINVKYGIFIYFIYMKSPLKIINRTLVICLGLVLMTA